MFSQFIGFREFEVNVAGDFMGTKQIVLLRKELIRVPEKTGFVVIRVNGFNHRMKHSDGRITIIPVHKNEDLPRGLLRKL